MIDVLQTTQPLHSNFFLVATKRLYMIASQSFCPSICPSKYQLAVQPPSIVYTAFSAIYFIFLMRSATRDANFLFKIIDLLIFISFSFSTIFRFPIPSFPFSLAVFVSFAFLLLSLSSSHFPVSLCLSMSLFVSLCPYILYFSLSIFVYSRLPFSQS